MAPAQFIAEQELKVGINFNAWLADDDHAVKIGFQLYAALLFCPNHQDEAKRLSLFFESLITSHPLTTVMSATFNNLGSSNNGIQDYTAMKMWFNYLYREFDTTLNFSLGPNVIALSTEKQLRDLAMLDPPYLSDTKLSNHIDLSYPAFEKTEKSGLCYTCRFELFVRVAIALTLLIV